MSFLCRLVLTVVMMTPMAMAEEVSFFVSPDGSDAHAGTAEASFRSLERARDAIRALRATDGLPEGGVTVNILPGLYPVRSTFELTAEDSGSPTAPITYRAAGPDAPRFHGGVQLTDFALVEDEAVLERLPESARGKVWVADLAAAGIEEPIPFERAGFGSGRGFQTVPAMELFVNGEPMTVARWPNEGFVKTGEVPGPLDLVGWDNRPGAEHGRSTSLGGTTGPGPSTAAFSSIASASHGGRRRPTAGCTAIGTGIGRIRTKESSPSTSKSRKSPWRSLGTGTDTDSISASTP